MPLIFSDFTGRGLLWLFLLANWKSVRKTAEGQNHFAAMIGHSEHRACSTVSDWESL